MYTHKDGQFLLSNSSKLSTYGQSKALNSDQFPLSAPTHLVHIRTHTHTHTHTLGYVVLYLTCKDITRSSTRGVMQTSYLWRHVLNLVLLINSDMKCNSHLCILQFGRPCKNPRHAEPCTADAINSWYGFNQQTNHITSKSSQNHPVHLPCEFSGQVMSMYVKGWYLNHIFFEGKCMQL